MPTAVKSRQNIFFRYVFDTRLVIFIRIVSVHHTIDLILCLAHPILLKIMEDDFYFGFAACQEAAVRNRNRQRAAKQTPKMCDWMSQLIFLVIPLFKINEYSEVMCSWCDSYTGTCKFGA